MHGEVPHLADGAAGAARVPARLALVALAAAPEGGEGAGRALFALGHPQVPGEGALAARLAPLPPGLVGEVAEVARGAQRLARDASELALATRQAGFSAHAGVLARLAGDAHALTRLVHEGPFGAEGARALADLVLERALAARVAALLLGLVLVFTGNKDLFSAVAVSGTASMYLAPVVFFSLWGKRSDIPVWSYLFTFVLALSGAALYFTESSGYSVLLGDLHKYTKLLYICISILVLGCLSYWLGGFFNRPANSRVKA